MPSPAHELAVLALGEEPALLALLLEKLAGIRLPAPLTREDATVRFAKAVEVRPDLLFSVAGGGSVAVEVQGDADDDKGRRWGVLMAVLHDGSGVMGDLVILTWSPRVARWAKRVGHATGPLGTTSKLTPIVLLLSGDVIGELLDATHPELAFFAAWAMQHRHGPRARKTVERALAVTDRLEPALRETQRRAIYRVLSGQMLALLKEAKMDLSKFPLSPLALEVMRLDDARYAASRARGKAEGEARGKAEGEARGKAEGRAVSVVELLDARGVAIPPEARARILACTDEAMLAGWLRRAAKASSVDELFGY